MTGKNPIFLAVDTIHLQQASRWAEDLAPHVGGLKLGLAFYLRHGLSGVRRIQSFGTDIFLDLKLHDIPNTVRGAVEAIAPVRPRYLTIHASGGPAMIEAARHMAPSETEIIAVSVLTSLDAGDLTAVGQGDDVAEQVYRLGKMAVAAGADGMVCSPFEVAPLRASLGPAATLIVPGIRPAGSAVGDQKRVMTPAEALAAGASKLVIGRPILAADDPVAAATAIKADISKVV